MKKGQNRDSDTSFQEFTQDTLDSLSNEER
jgi:hypothetical protein